MSSEAKQELRSKLRAARNSITQANKDLAAQKLRDNVCQLRQFQQAKNIALYWPHDGEISTIPLITSVLAQHKQCLLPVLVLATRQQLAFATYTLDTPMLANRYGILEPELSFSYICDFDELELIFVPLVGFDSAGQRLGMGGGFYDATFASNLKHKTKGHSPQLVGLAYSCQQVDQLPNDSWDWQLDAVVTDSEVFLI